MTVPLRDPLNEPEFREFQAETERRLRREGAFDLADMYRELTSRFPCSDVTVFDRGRTSALIQILGGVPKGLTVYPEGG